MDHQRVLSEGIRATARLAGAPHANVRIEHRRDEQLIDIREGHNVVVDTGRAAVAGLINGVITNFFDAIGIGTGATGEVVGDTTLQTEITTGGGARAASSNSRVTTDTTNDTARCTTTFTFTASFAVTESGLFDQTTVAGSVMLSRKTFAALNVISGDTLQIIWTIDVD